jgi:hypothetical protein
VAQADGCSLAKARVGDLIEMVRTRQYLHVHHHSTFLAEHGRLRHVEYRGMRAQTVEPRGKILPGLIVDLKFEYVDRASGEGNRAVRFETKYSHMVAPPGQ